MTYLRVVNEDYLHVVEAIKSGRVLGWSLGLANHPTVAQNLFRIREDLYLDQQTDNQRVEAALEDVSLPETGALDVDATVLPDSVGVDAAEADAVIDAGGGTLTVAAETGGDAATVVVDSGSEAMEIAVEDGGEIAAEVVVEVLAGALEV